jgi:hypothetical protein
MQGFRQCKYYVKIEFLTYREYGTDQSKDQPVNARKIMDIHCMNHKRTEKYTAGENARFCNIKAVGTTALKNVFDNGLSVMSFT